MENLIEKINAKGKAIQDEKVRQEKEKREIMITLYDNVKNLAPRISKLWDICQALLDNGFRLGKQHYHAGFKYYQFETDGIYHWVGFYIHNNVIYGFGKQGGGCCFDSVLITKDGRIGHYSNGNFIEDKIDDICSINIRYECAPIRGYRYQNKHFTDKLQEIYDKFDDIEKGIIEYANNVVNS